MKNFLYLGICFLIFSSCNKEAEPTSATPPPSPGITSTPAQTIKLNFDGNNLTLGSACGCYDNNNAQIWMGDKCFIPPSSSPLTFLIISDLVDNSAGTVIPLEGLLNHFDFNTLKWFETSSGNINIQSHNTSSKVIEGTFSGYSKEIGVTNDSVSVSGSFNIPYTDLCYGS